MIEILFYLQSIRVDNAETSETVLLPEKDHEEGRLAQLLTEKYQQKLCHTVLYGFADFSSTPAPHTDGSNLLG